MGKAQNLARTELKSLCSDEHRYIVMNTGTCVLICVDVCCFAWNSSNSSGEGSKSSSKRAQIFI